ncbi:FAD-binding protein [Streptomyces sp. NBC_00201]|uniref:FAD-binding protein n=1 Tax=unclassified Streptomyces TaxID=2593676 RepID=UPI002250F162|nr:MULTISPECIES: FAD-binding protein [unclassified Streptomyces]MCX5063238.1 FAD-binding protein [Streptomyces sp. NBC_00452]MCX5251078.1 FAD-binding protein [Streptomyces sp. NBC_00201]MCX5290993.1 FAD-binding protein [Streptomyces sp. NBC_00183]
MTAQTQVDVVVLGAGLAGLSAAATAAAEGASTFGGIEVAAEGTVVDASGRPVRGLYAAGADMGDAYHEGYGGGLCLAVVSGRRAGRLAAARTRRRTPVPAAH